MPSTPDSIACSTPGLSTCEAVVVDVGLGIELAARGAADRERRRDLVAVVGLDLVGVGPRAQWPASGSWAVDDLDRRRAARALASSCRHRGSATSDDERERRAQRASLRPSISPRAPRGTLPMKRPGRRL